MYRKFMNALQMLNLLLQSIYTLAFPIGIGALASFLLVEYASAPRWIWAILLTLGVFMGLYSMVKFILSAISGMERQEKQRQQELAAKKEKEERHSRLRDAATKNELKDEQSN